MGLFSKLFGGGTKAKRTTTASDPLRIAEPAIGFLNLQGAKGAALLEADRAALAPLFKLCRLATDAPPKCQVLLLYCDVDADGRLSGSASTIRGLVKDAGAYVAIVASENRPEPYLKAAAGRSADWSANIVLVMERKGEKFGVFFRRLFEAMFRGRTMPMAWVELAPQIPGRDQPDAPATIMLAEAGHIVFDRAGQK